MENHHEKSKGDGAGGTLKVQLDKSIYIENKFHHNPKEVLDYCKEELSYNHVSGRTCSWVFFLTPDQVIKKEDEKDFERFHGALKICQVFKTKDHQIGIREAGCVCQSCRILRFDIL